MLDVELDKQDKALYSVLIAGIGVFLLVSMGIEPILFYLSGSGFGDYLMVMVSLVGFLYLLLGIVGLLVSLEVIPYKHISKAGLVITLVIFLIIASILINSYWGDGSFQGIYDVFQSLLWFIILLLYAPLVIACLMFLLPFIFRNRKIAVLSSLFYILIPIPLESSLIYLKDASPDIIPVLLIKLTEIMHSSISLPPQPTPHEIAMENISVFLLHYLVLIILGVIFGMLPLTLAYVLKRSPENPD